ncbi:Glycine cleavage system transcriptional activator [Marinobacterium lacunae]|uniref:Glycine cleavage system transcriptional activator n=1 Tax=Marinobacterium lacunae TaxID=1232683 RepID=A0A081FWR8_9GAMM|nr:LysR substrate-binding domain-containing protein [Marinobacterium lacunae]KEA62973.1 Glycine cleavage system transcriptional activator [Marinobacterium lacunae]
MHDALMNLNGIRVFEAAARLGSFKLAAEALCITPTAVSHQIRNLESRLDVALFERGVRQVRLTAAGTILAEAAQTSLQTLAAAFDRIGREGKQLTVSTTASFAALWLVPRLEGFSRLHPELEVFLQTGERPLDLKREAQVDIAIRYGVPPQPEATLLLQESFGFYATEQVIARIEAGEPVRALETTWKNTDLPAIGVAQWREQYGESIKVAGITRHNQEMHVTQAALAGQGVAFLSSLMAESAVEHGWLRPVKPQCTITGMGYYLVIGSGAETRPRVCAFKDWLESELRTDAV